MSFGHSYLSLPPRFADFHTSSSTGGVDPASAASRGSENALPAKSRVAFCGSSLPVRGDVLGDVTNTAGFKPALSLGGISKPPPASVSASVAPDDVLEDRKEAQYVREYVDDIYRTLQREEARLLPQLGYMDRQPAVNPKMREILVDWIVDVHKTDKLRPETLFLAINVIDRFLEKTTISRQLLQLVGVSSLLIAAKFEEIYPPEISRLVEVTDNAYTRNDVIRMENSILRALEFQICRPTSLHFLDRYLQTVPLARCKKGSTDSHRYLAQYLLELTLVDYRMLKYTPSHLAAAALLLSNRLLQSRTQPDWPRAAELETQMTKPMLIQCAKEICELLEVAETSSLKAVRKKYSQAKYNSVATTDFMSEGGTR